MKAERNLLSLLRGEPELQINEMNERCIICDGQIKYKFNAKDLNQKTTQDTFYYYECIDCHTQQLKNVPPNLGDYYGDYAAHELPSSIEDYQTKARNQQWRVDILKKFKKSGRLLEIGPSIGAFAYASQMNGFEVDVIEFNNLCCTYMSKNTQIKAINS